MLKFQLQVQIFSRRFLQRLQLRFLIASIHFQSQLGQLQFRRQFLIFSMQLKSPVSMQLVQHAVQIGEEHFPKQSYQQQYQPRFYFYVKHCLPLFMLRLSIDLMLYQLLLEMQRVQLLLEIGGEHFQSRERRGC